jgi:hypothetical protein
LEGESLPKLVRIDQWGNLLSHHFKRKIDQAGFYETTLSQTEITALSRELVSGQEVRIQLIEFLH